MISLRDESAGNSKSRSGPRAQGDAHDAFCIASRGCGQFAQQERSRIMKKADPVALPMEAVRQQSLEIATIKAWKFVSHQADAGLKIERTRHCQLSPQKP